MQHASRWEAAGAVAARGLAAGLAVGALDAIATLILLGDAAGPAAARLETVAGALLVDTAVVLGALGAAAGLARPVRGGPALRGALATGLVVAAAGLLAVKLHAELAPRAPALLPRQAGAVALALALGAVAFLAVRRRAAAPAAPRRALAFGLAAAAAALGFAVGGAPAAPPPAAGEARPSVLLVSLDTLRADRVGAYGAAGAHTPHLDALAAEGALFEAAWSTANWTLPSHASLLTGKDPRVHGVVGDRDVLAPAHETLGERFRAAGYRTAAFVGTQARAFVGAHRGFGRGFEHYRHEPHPPAALEGLFARALHRLWLARVAHGVGAASGQVDAASRWLRAHADEPFLLFLHLYDVHSKSHRRPYDAPAAFRERLCPEAPAGFDGCDGGACASFWLDAVMDGRAAPPAPEVLDHVRCLYDAGLAYTDAALGRLLTTLEATGAAGRTVVVVTSDHGEAFLEHGHLLHRHLHEEVARIPLLVRAPGGRAGVRIATPVSLADVAPTVLDLAGLAPPEGATGASLAAAVREGREPPARPVHALGREAAVRVGRYKLLLPRSPEARPPALHDLARDPGERENLLGDGHAPVRRQLEAELARLEEAEPSGAPAPSLELSADDRSRLEALGYLVD